MSKSINNFTHFLALNYQQSETENNKYGFTKFSEKLNGRVAMVGFILFYFIELVTKKNLLQLILINALN
jgi:hypothetical protein